MAEQSGALRYDVVVDPDEETSQGKLVRYAGRDKLVLDLGCATGGVARALVSRGCKVWGVELDADAAALAEGVCEQVVVGDLDMLDLVTAFPGVTFDVVLAGDVLEHLKDPSRVLDQAAKLLSPAGYVVLSVPNMAHGSVRLALLHGDLPRSDTGLLDRSHIQYLTRTQLVELVEQAGFAISYLDATIAPIESSDVAYPRDSLTEQVIDGLRRDPEALTYQYVVVAFPGSVADLPPLGLLVSKLSEELRTTRQFAANWEHRGSLAEGRADALTVELTAERQQAERGLDEQVSAQLAPLRQDLLVARDQLMHRDHDVQRVIGLYERHTLALRESEADRRRLHDEIVRSHAESAALLAEITALRATRTWRIGQRLAQIARGRVTRDLG